MKRAIVVRFAATLAAALVAGWFGAASAAENEAARGQGGARPNIIIILADDMGYGEASCYGNTAYRTPHIDRLAREGLKFTDFHSSGSVCSPTRAGLVTGRYQQRAGIDGVVYADPNRNRHHGLQANEITFANLFKDAGYATGLVGKWHLGYQPQYNPVHRGFDYFRGYVSGNIDFHNHLDGTAVHDWWHNDQRVREPGYVTHLITRYALDFIQANRDNPFVLYIAHEAPHAPYQGPNDKPIRVEGQKPGREVYPDGHIERAYRQMMQEMDRSVGAVVEALKRLNIDRRTFVFFFSDNGANEHGSNGPLRGTKGSLWEGGHRVPAIAWWPGRIKPNTTTDQLAISIDLFPTMLDLAGLAAPSDHRFDGVSLVPVFDAKPLRQRNVFWSYLDRRVMRDGPWKLLVGQSDRPPVRGKATTQSPEPDAPPLMLFNLAEDLGETNNLAAQHPDRVKQMLKAIEAWHKDVTTGATPQPD